MEMEINALLVDDEEQCVKTLQERNMIFRFQISLLWTILQRLEDN